MHTNVKNHVLGISEKNNVKRDFPS